MRGGERGRCSRWYKFLDVRGGEGKEYEERDDIGRGVGDCVL